MLVPTEVSGPFSIGGLNIVPYDQDHGFCRTLGFRFGAFAFGCVSRSFSQ